MFFFQKCYSKEFNLILFRAKNNYIGHSLFIIIIFSFFIISLKLSAIFLPRTLHRGDTRSLGGWGWGGESLSNVLHQWANRFKTIMPRNRKLKMTVADTEQRLFPLNDAPYPYHFHTLLSPNGFMGSRLCDGFPLQKA